MRGFSIVLVLCLFTRPCCASGVCSVFPLFSAVAGTIALGPVCAVLVACNTFLATLMIPYLAVKTVWAVLVSHKIGFNLKVFALATVWLPVMAFPLLAAAGSLLYGIGVSYITFWKCKCRVNKLVKRTADGVVDFWWDQAVVDVSATCLPHATGCQCSLAGMGACAVSRRF